MKIPGWLIGGIVGLVYFLIMLAGEILLVEGGFDLSRDDFGYILTFSHLPYVMFISLSGGDLLVNDNHFMLTYGVYDFLIGMIIGFLISKMRPEDRVL